MKIALDISPLKSGHFLQHRVRGTGFYTKNLIDSLQRYFPDNQYTIVMKGKKLLVPVDIFHIPYFEPFFLTIPLKKFARTVVTVHDLTPLVFSQHFPAGIKGKLKWQIQKNSLKHTDAIITDSQSSKKDIIQFTGVNEAKVHVVYLAAGEQFKKTSNILKKYNIPEKFALYVGDVTWNKNLVRLVQAIKKTEVPLVIVGKAILEKNFDKTNPWNQERMRLHHLLEEDSKSTNQIHCLGFVMDDDLVTLYNMATVFVMPSLYEGFGLPILEAMNCGCPVITTKEGSLPEVGGNAAYFVNAYDVDDIASGIQEVFSHEKLQKILSEKGLEHVKKFSWQKTAEETVHVYHDTLNQVCS